MSWSVSFISHCRWGYLFMVFSCVWSGWVQVLPWQCIDEFSGQTLLFQAIKMHLSKLLETRYWAETMNVEHLIGGHLDLFSFWVLWSKFRLLSLYFQLELFAFWGLMLPKFSTYSLRKNMNLWRSFLKNEIREMEKVLIRQPVTFHLHAF